jgi:hypothetical protein
VNLATHLLLDTLQPAMDAAVVISNDSDLKLPIRRARAPFAERGSRERALRERTA